MLEIINHIPAKIHAQKYGYEAFGRAKIFPIVELVDKMIKTNPDKKTYEELYNEITSIVSKVEQSVKERFSAYNDFTLEQLIIEHVDMPKSDVMPTATSLRSKITAKLGRKLTSSVEDIIYQYSFMLESFSNDHATEVFNYGINKLKKAYLEMMLKEHRGLTSEEIIKELSFLKEVSGESIKEKIYNAFNEFVAEQSHEGELHQINVELTRYDYHERQLKKLKDPEVEVHKSKKHGFELVDFINEPRVLVLFSKPQDADHILELVRNLRRLTAQKIKAHRDLKSFFRNDEPLYELVIGKLTEAEILGLADGTISPEKFSGLFSAEEYEKIVNLNLEHKIKIEFAPHKESYESFIRKHINVANFNAKHDIDTLDGLLRTYVKERLKVHAGSGKVKAYGLQDFLWTHSDQLASIQIHSLKAIEKQLKKDKSALDKFKKRVYSVAEAYVKASGKLGKARSAVMSFAAIFIGAVIGAPGIGLLPKYFDTKARIAVYDADASTGTESIAYHAGQEQAYAEQQQASLQLIESLSAERDFLLNGDGEVDRSISWLREQAAVKLDAAKDLDPLEDTNHDEVVSPEEDLAGNGNGEADDFYISKINGDVAQAIDLVELYNGGFGAELSYHEMFTNPQCHYHVSKPTLTADVTGVGNVGDPNPFYTESGTWSEEALDGIEEYQNHYEAEDLRAEAEAFNDEADDLQEDVDEITDQITAQQILLNGEEFTDTDGNGVWNEGEPFVDSDGNGTYTPGIVDLQASSSALKTFYTNLRSAAIDTLHDYSTGLIILGIIEGVIVTYLGGRKLYNYLKRRGQGPIGHPTFEDLCYLTKTVPGEEEFVKIEY